jgi:hypothetical protein
MEPHNEKNPAKDQRALDLQVILSGQETASHPKSKKKVGFTEDVSTWGRVQIPATPHF